MTLLLNGQAVNVRLASTSVTVRRGSIRFRNRAQVAPANPPPMTTTRPAAPCAIAGIGSSAHAAPAAVVLRNVRRLLSNGGHALSFNSSARRTRPQSP